ncbi:MAG: glyoxalase/bleomycin resistance/dioxygenase family protein [Bacteroidetes bacterium]|jgi:predicted enzyme related to lactoylglutathione lyase|nr:glyoxalase/bleomycin resistance/dioxygenase family protein [Bacteroidota bacterium]
MRAKATGIGGVFFKCKDGKALREWYHKHLGIAVEDYGASFSWNKTEGHTVWGTFKQETQYFDPSQKEFMINFRVDNLELLLKQLQEEGINPVGEMQIFEYGKFAHIMDPESNKIELWEPNDEEYAKLVK